MEFQKVLPSDSAIVMYAKIALNQGRSPGLEKDAFYDAIVKRAEALRADGESKERAFTKAITEDETGRLLYRAMQIAPGAEVRPPPAPDAVKDFAKAQEAGGPAHAKLHSMVIDYQRAHAGVTYQSAYSSLYTRDENQALREQIKAEHMAQSMAGMRG
jgi:hypothetical protein